MKLNSHNEWDKLKKRKWETIKKELDGIIIKKR